jgi:hypothetical protein
VTTTQQGGASKLMVSSILTISAIFTLVTLKLGKTHMPVGRSIQTYFS